MKIHGQLIYLLLNDLCIYLIKREYFLTECKTIISKTSIYFLSNQYINLFY